MNFSVIALVYNEEERITYQLNQFKNFTDDIIVFDTESTDNTSLIAKTFTNRIFQVPFVGYCDCYKEHAQWKAKYDWILWSYTDEIWSEELLTWIKKLEEDIDKDVIFFHRYEELDGKREEPDFGFHLRFHRKGLVYHPDLMDCDMFLSNRHSKEKQFFIHSKSSKERDKDKSLRIIACKLLINRYRLTEFEPYKSYVKAYGEWLKQNDN